MGRQWPQVRRSSGFPFQRRERSPQASKRLSSRLNRKTDRHSGKPFSGARMIEVYQRGASRRKKEARRGPAGPPHQKACDEILSIRDNVMPEDTPYPAKVAASSAAESYTRTISVIPDLPGHPGRTVTIETRVRFDPRLNQHIHIISGSIRCHTEARHDHHEPLSADPSSSPA